VDGKEYALFCASDRDLASEGRTDGKNERVLLDLNAAAEGREYADMGVCDPSPDGRYLAWSVDTQGDEVFTFRVRNLATGTDELVTDRSYYTSAWSADSGTVFYTVPDATTRPYQVWRHRVGEEAADDVLVVEEPDGRFELTVGTSRSGQLVLVRANSRTTTEISWIPAAAPTESARVVWPRREGIEYELDHVAAGTAEDGELLLVTNDGAPEFRVLRAAMTTTGPRDAAELFGPEAAVRWERADVIGRHVVVSGRRDAMPFLRVLGLDSSAWYDIGSEPPAGQVSLARNEDPTATDVRIRTQILVQPPEWYDVDLATGARTLVKRLEVPTYDAGRYVTERVWATASDGSRIPVSLARHRDTPLDGTAPCLLYGYGAYEAVDEPAWDAALPSLLDRGVVFVHTHVRGGGEGGRHWWLDGRLERKQHTFSDHIAVADGLAAERLVDDTRIATRGLSAGGLLQGAVLSQRPDRWRAVVAEVPFVDVVTTMLDPDVPLTANEWDEWGDPRRPADFEWMRAYSPYDNLPAAGGRPDLMVTGALHDPRVMVFEPAKWVAALRESDPEWSPRCVFRAETGAGAHGGPSGRFAHLAYEAEVYAWLLDKLDATESVAG
jgi:oligopeptidase B